MTIFDDNFWWQFLMPILMTILMTIFDDKFWWQFLDDNFFWDLFSTCDLWYLRHWLQYWQLRTWIHDNLCYLTINCDTGQYLQFLRCYILKVFRLHYRVTIALLLGSSLVGVAKQYFGDPINCQAGANSVFVQIATKDFLGKCNNVFFIRSHWSNGLRIPLPFGKYDQLKDDSVISSFWIFKSLCSHCTIYFSKKKLNEFLQIVNSNICETPKNFYIEVFGLRCFTCWEGYLQ